MDVQVEIVLRKARDCGIWFDMLHTLVRKWCTDCIFPTTAFYCKDDTKHRKGMYLSLRILQTTHYETFVGGVTLGMHGARYVLSRCASIKSFFLAKMGAIP